MGKLIDLTGQKFGDLTVTKRGPNTTDGKAQWYCQCACGKEVLRTSKTLRHGATNCGCQRTSNIVTPAEKFGRLTVLQRNGSDNNNKSMWRCQCDCGTVVSVRGSDLVSGKIQSCGCLKTEQISLNLIDQRFGRLIVKNKTSQRKNGQVVWLCQCDCGNEILVTTNHLTTNNTQSCGCLVSKEEQIIGGILKNNNIEYKTQYIFFDLIGKNNTPLRYDFGILKNQRLVGLIEYQGIQHYQNVYNLPQKDWLYSLERDRIKKEYCIQHSIPLLEIKYDENIETKLQQIKEWMK